MNSGEPRQAAAADRPANRRNIYSCVVETQAEEMAKRVCPWWLGYLLVSPVRRWLQNPAAVVEPFVKEGAVVLEPGPGMGFFTVELARRVGPQGRVIAVDIQPRMIAALRRRLAKAGLLGRVETRIATPDSLGLSELRGKVDFALAMAVVHEMPGADWFFGQLAPVLKPGASLLLAEPSGHVKQTEFEAELAAAAASGFLVTARPAIRRSQAALLTKSGAE
jgi:ubiquinone/menaquinone biosynthesis C-methylase UbiE